MAEIERMYNLTDASEYLGSDPRKLRRLIADGKLPAVKVGRTWCIKESTIKKIQDGELEV
ncbi:helix-turn-helix domain-containing protein [Methanofollis fontis]|nr:helix-turn-helix domain-containing protein [Methanofollis fontis]